jgi:Zn-dependent protease
MVCPGCQRLVHADRLKALIGEATDAGNAGNRVAELTALQTALSLLPPGSKQYASIADKIASLSTGPLLASQPAAPESRFWKWVVGLGPIGLVLWKLKFLVVALLANGKFLLLGLTKASTFLSMLLAFGVYWSAWGMWFAAGFVVSIYIHEMGHVVALRRYGIPATAPMFVPGLGAFIRLRQGALPPYQNARVGLAGPLWGAGAAAAAWAVAKFGGGPMWSAIAHTGAWINVFNLLPVWQLDGNRGFSALGSFARWSMVAAFAVGYSTTGDGLFVLLAVVAAVRALDRLAPEQTDLGIWLQLTLILAALVAIMRLAAPAAP